MTGPHPAVAACRRGVRAALSEAALPPGSTVVTACSGGPDSLALAAAVAFEAPKQRLTTVAVVVDHQLQEGSGDVALRALEQCRDLGIDQAAVRTVDVAGTGDGPEAAARDARYAALAEAAASYDAGAVLLGHTSDDQAETVLLALARGSGPRALTGMARASGVGVRWLRPLLDVTRDETHAACAALRLEPWHDPHNDDPRYLRVRVRKALADLEADIGPGVVAGLTRTAELIRDDLTHLDDSATRLATELGESPWPVDELAAIATPLRTRVWRELLRRAGSPAASLGKVHIDAVDALVTRWHGQQPIHIPGSLQVRRGAGLIVVERRQVQ
ncbi:tRNA(Ile)-lysidine synthase [Flexivirga endophytica]|uniref:tRNA(Ile)-lysidine synthase n=1 Tax=Flexivirga endophytica TaxID=1849103 RepID=A0A916WRY8_9MICO|nr:tRNA lysidine(34) synthetase TilS [Flexivirga endophytica]GGB27087.1 tRNA(Ile)-lysidine synthase [Flexivirga endophytica]GHB55574.1 tRNA(Ile)-lysidine synthase [Flexivirga endophytica]